MEMAEKTFLEDNFNQLHNDVKKLTEKIQEVLVRFAVFEEQRSTNVAQIAELKTKNETLTTRVDALEKNLSYYKGAIAVLYIFLLPILGALVTLIVKMIFMTSQSN